MLLNDSVAVREIFASIHDPEEWKLWSDSSGKSDPPPDFYNDKLKLMMDVMRIDDHAFESKNGKIVNPTNQRESVIQKQIRKSGLLDSFPNVKNVIVTAVTDLPTDEDHNYKFYYSNFERVLMKHNNQIDLYGKNHPGYKTIFLVLDESSAYFEMESMPCFIEQQKIVACLSALDDVIEKKKATLAAWEELKKGLLQQMFV